MIRFTKIIIEGFGSYVEPTEFKLDRPGLNIIIANNGSGKTTLFSALRWTISEQPLKNTKDVTTWDFLRPKTFKGTKTILHFVDDNTHDKYQIIRCRNYKDKIEDGNKGANRVILLKNKVCISDGSKRENQAEIYKVLGFNDDILINSMIFGQRMKKLIESSGPDKKRVFEEAFSATFIKDAKDRASEDLSSASQQLTSLTHELDINREKLKGERALYKSLKKQRLEFDKDKEGQLDKVRKELKAYQKELNSLTQSDEETITQMEDKLNKAKQGYYSLISNKPDRMEIMELKSKHTQLLKDKEALNKVYEKVNQDVLTYQDTEARCKACGGKISNIKRKAILREAKGLLVKAEKELYDQETQIINLATQIEAKEKEYESSKKSHETLVSKANDKIKDYEQKLKTLSKSKLRYSMLIEYIKSAKGRLVEIGQKRPPKVPINMKVSLKETEQLCKDQETQLEQLTQQVEDLKWVVNDLLGNKGLKSYIFDTMLGSLNQLLVHYEQFIGFRPEFRVDLDSANKDIYAVCYRGEQMIFYEDLSGGQQQLVDTVTAFALYDLISTDKPTNLLVFDEPFESLSEDSADLVLELIQNKAINGKSLYIITHNLALQHSSSKVIRMSLNDKGRTQLKSL